MQNCDFGGNGSPATRSEKTLRGQLASMRLLAFHVAIATSGQENEAEFAK